MIAAAQKANIRRLFHGEHWKIGTIAAELGLHPDTVRAALESERFKRGPAPRAALTDPYLDFMRQTLEQHPRLRATRLYQMLRDRGYSGSVVQLRRVVATLRPARHEAFLRLTTLPDEQAFAVQLAERDMQSGISFAIDRARVSQETPGLVFKSFSSIIGFISLHHINLACNQNRLTGH